MKNKKKPEPMNPEKVAQYLDCARTQLQKAMLEDMGLDKFILTLEDGHKLTLEELHGWLIAGMKHYLENGPRAAAMRVIIEACPQSPKILSAN